MGLWSLKNRETMWLHFLSWHLLDVYLCTVYLHISIKQHHQLLIHGELCLATEEMACSLAYARLRMAGFTGDKRCCFVVPISIELDYIHIWPAKTRPFSLSWAMSYVNVRLNRHATLLARQSKTSMGLFFHPSHGTSFAWYENRTTHEISKVPFLVFNLTHFMSSVHGCKEHC